MTEILTVGMDVALSVKLKKDLSAKDTALDLVKKLVMVTGYSIFLATLSLLAVLLIAQK